MVEKGISRRSLLKGAGLGVGATVIGVVAAPVGASEGDAIFGVIDQIITASRSVVLRTTDGLTVVQFQGDALFWKDEQTTLEAFTSGDEVYVDGDPVGEVVLGRVMKSVLRILEGEIQARDGNLLWLSTGVIEILSTTQPHEGGGKRVAAVAQLKAGDVVSAMGRSDPSSGNLVAAKIGLLQVS